MAAVSEKRMREARQYLDDAAFLYNENFGNPPLLTKLYHSMLYSLFALFEIEDTGDLTHADLIARFERDLVDTGDFDRVYAEALLFAHSFLHECECGGGRQPEDKDIERLYPIAREFVKKVEDYLSG